VDDGGGVVGLDGAAEGLAAGQDRGLVGLGDFLLLRVGEGRLVVHGSPGVLLDASWLNIIVELRSAVLVSQLLR
jgi:hypothetical protein